MGAVPVVIHGVAGVRYGIDAEHVVNHAIGVVVDPVVRNFSGIRPHVRGKIRMVIVNPGIHDADDDGSGARAQAPGFGRVDVRIGSATALPCIVESPELIAQWVIREGLRLVELDEVVGFGQFDKGIGAVQGDGLFDAD